MGKTFRYDRLYYLTKVRTMLAAAGANPMPAMIGRVLASDLLRLTKQKGERDARLVVLAALEDWNRNQIGAVIRADAICTRWGNVPRNLSAPVRNDDGVRSNERRHVDWVQADLAEAALIADMLESQSAGLHADAQAIRAGLAFAAAVNKERSEAGLEPVASIAAACAVRGVDVEEMLG